MKNKTYLNIRILIFPEYSHILETRAHWLYEVQYYW